MDGNEEYMRQWILEWVSRWGTSWVPYEKANLEMETTPHFAKQDALGYLEISKTDMSGLITELEIRLTPKAIEFLRGGVEVEKGRSPVKEGMGHIVKGMNAFDAGMMAGELGLTDEERIDKETKFLNEIKARKDILQEHKEYLTTLSQHRLETLTKTLTKVKEQ